jgi:Superinfection immunity protein
VSAVSNHEAGWWPHPSRRAFRAPQDEHKQAHVFNGADGFDGGNAHIVRKRLFPAPSTHLAQHPHPRAAQAPTRVPPATPTHRSNQPAQFRDRQHRSKQMDNFVFVIAIAAVYFIPSMVGFSRHHQGRYMIVFLNLCLGWTIIGWIGVLVLAASTTVIPAGASK